MAMRYIFRRPQPENFADLRKEVKDLDQQLGTPGEKFRRFVRVSFSPSRYAQYTFLTRKVGADWQWIATSVELVAENEQGLFALTDKYQVPRPEHLASR